MKKSIKFNKKNIIIVISSLIYIYINIFYLTKFPFIHSDEAWLSGLSRNIFATGSFASTETFFDLYIRHPHAIKSIFHGIQIFFINIMGYSIFTVRFISFFFAILTLVYFFKLNKLIFKGRSSMLAVIFLSLDIQFIYASHFARQEIIILFAMILALYFLYKNIDKTSLISDILIGCIVGLSIGVHPNSFIISIVFLLIYIYLVFIKIKSYKNAATYILTTAVFACIFVALSLQFDPHFFYDYSKFGSQFYVFTSPSFKAEKILYFYVKLFYGTSGTYYTPEIKFQLLLFLSVFIIASIKIYKDVTKRIMIFPIILGIIAINIGIFSIGRFNQTSVLFEFPLFYILVSYVLNSLKNNYKMYASAILSMALIAVTLFNVLPYLNNNYDGYLNQISKYVNKDDSVLANLNCDYYFENGKLHDYRNLTFLKDNNMKFDEYIKYKNIKYIIYPEEMDYIYENKPEWDDLYGSQEYYYKDMKKYFESNCSLVYQFIDRTYGNRIAENINKKNWWIKIYKVN